MRNPGSACATPSGSPTVYSHDAAGQLTGSSSGFDLDYTPSRPPRSGDVADGVEAVE